MNIEIDFKKLFYEYSKDKIENLGYIKANQGNVKGITYKLNYIEKGIREISPAYCVSPIEFYGDDEIDKHLLDANKNLDDYFGDDPEGLIVCEKVNDEFNVQYNMGQMVTPFYPLFANFEFEKIDKEFYKIIEDNWLDLGCEQDMISGIESAICAGDGTGDGLFKDTVNLYIQLNIDKLKELSNEFIELFNKYKIKMDSFNKIVYLLNLPKENIQNIKNALFDFIFDIYDLSINGEKIYLRDLEDTIKNLNLDNNKKKNKKEAR